MYGLAMVINVNITHNNSPYRFDALIVSFKELIYGGTYKLTRLDDISVSVKNKHDEWGY